MKIKKYITLIENDSKSISENEIESLDCIAINENEYSIIDNGKTIKSTILSRDYNRGLYSIEIEGETVEVKILTETDQIVNDLGINTKHKQNQTYIVAPMPGLVLEILQSENNQVKKGDSLIIVEAMKMENTIKIQHDAVIKNILVEKGQSIEKGQILFELE